jgi:hypothetical protein
MKDQKIVYRFHALRRMFERKISESEVVEAIQNGKVIEDYPTDTPYPSQLILGTSQGKSIHLVIAFASDTKETIVITVYEPDLSIWEPNFESRRKS